MRILASVNMMNQASHDELLRCFLQHAILVCVRLLKKSGEDGEDEEGNDSRKENGDAKQQDG